MGRPTDCTPELTQQVVELVKKYGFIKTVFMYLGMNPQRHYEWLEKAESEEDETSPYTVYAETVKKALAEWQMNHLDRLQEGEAKWQSSGWSLERSDPEQFARKEKREHSGSVSTGAAPIDTPAELAERRRRVLGERAPGPH